VLAKKAVSTITSGPAIKCRALGGGSLGVEIKSSISWEGRGSGIVNG
jgi:hypothetical protein